MLLAGVHVGTGAEFLYPERVQIEVAFDLGILRKQHLKPAVEPKAIHLVGTQPPAYGIARLQQYGRVAGGLQGLGGNQAGHSSTNDDKLRLLQIRGGLGLQR